MAVRPEPFFLTTAAGPRFCLYTAPALDPLRGGILYAHPFTEEMNKSRHMVAAQARQLGAQGWAVLQIDLTGCGDSAGDFGDATWALWLDDLAAGWQWLQARLNPETGAASPCWLWGTRLGGLLAAEFAARATPAAAGLLLWQPVTSGAQHLKQFLRLRTVQGLLQQSDAAVHSATAPAAGENVQTLLAELGRGQSLEVAGYQIAPGLASGMQSAELSKLQNLPSTVHWLEVSTHAAVQPAADLSPASQRIVMAWQQRGMSVQTRLVNGPAFWQTQEIEAAPELLVATTQALHAVNA
jgi:exosortase A-associated hydrolase 2